MKSKKLELHLHNAIIFDYSGFTSDTAHTIGHQAATIPNCVL